MVKNHEFYLRKCLNLAVKGYPKNKPNPMVGCVIVCNEKIIGEGYHENYGSHHAEVNAINSVKDKSLLSKSTIYVNLEPCSHFGKTPPCSELIIEKKIPKVVIGCIDTFSKVSGKGIEKMKKSGIEVILGVLEKESRDINKRFFTFHEKKRPYIILKWAKSSDGYIAPKNQNKPFWMTSKDSKKLVHKWRSQEDSILVGRKTAEIDNPKLTVREFEGQNPIRVIIDKNLQLSNNINLYNDDSVTFIFNEIKEKSEGSNFFKKINFINMIDNILSELYKQNIQSIIIEGGNKTLQSFIKKDMWDEARIFTTNNQLKDGVRSPKIYGKTIYTEQIDSDRLEIIIPR